VSPPEHGGTRDVFDVVVVGAGVVGCAVARALSRYRLKVAVLESGADVAGGASKANSGVVHAGFNNPTGSLKARFCVEGNAGFAKLCDELGVPFNRVGKFVVALAEDDIGELERLAAQGERNGVPGLEIIDGSQMRVVEPNVKGVKALWSGSSGIVEPWSFTIALAESAVDNGVRFFLEHAVKGLEQIADGFRLQTDHGPFEARCVVNAAGAGAPDIAAMAGWNEYSHRPARGQYLALDRRHATLVRSMIYPVPPKGGGVLGVHVTPTIEGVTLLGPSGDIDEAGGSTTAGVMRQLEDEARALIPDLPRGAVIRSFAGVRSRLSKKDGEWDNDYVIKEYPEGSGCVHLMGIESPGLTASWPIALEVVSMLGSKLEYKLDPTYDPVRLGRRPFARLSPGKQEMEVRQDPSQGRMVCRCEHVTEAEVLAALENPLGARSLNAVKYRTRCGMGRCQGGFCTPRVIELMEKEGMAPEKVTLKGGKSRLFAGRTKEVALDE